MNHLDDHDGAQYICKVLYESLQIPVFLLDANRRIELALPSSSESAPWVHNINELLSEIVDPTKSENISNHDSSNSSIPIIRTTNFLENYILLHLPLELSGGRIIVVGPSLYTQLSGDNVSSLMHDNDVPHGLQDQWLTYYRSLPVLNRMRLYHTAMLLYSLVTGKTLTLSELLLDSRVLEPKQLSSDSLDLDVSYRRENTWLHHEPIMEKALFHHVKNGNKAELLRVQATFSEENYGVLSKKSQLRSKKNLAVSCITLATRAAIDGGLYWEISYTLSDFHIQHIEELKDIPAVDHAILNALCDFADHVRNNRSAQLSRTVAICQNYIFNHLYEELSLDKLAVVASLNRSYLSQLFKKETGFTVSDFIQIERIEEAKRLIELPGISLSDIATRLHFNDQSYFTKVFKKYTGITPRQFKTNKESNSN
ncbi:helix-turn-helix domain-containing protein [Paenibacillus pseudetheri]|uniref:HTH-type transcriptional activator RhaR n=1 Tax=Paenibacillus pseudetheri TaxID=2897682 RepID=A0ABN8FNM5_9BACL|nr:AraC family transcriptional regulator [Paenibacillus pseudetheri]CAH1057450.1 HTH-type transcriptional activator RhaR [Paenibacillus pseudetheri]